MRVSENAIFRISPQTFDEIDAWIRAAQQSGRNTRYGMNALVMLMAYTNLGIAQEMSRGPVQPEARHRRVMLHNGRIFTAGTSGPATPTPVLRDAAWKIPVRRITGNYYRGWKVRRIAPGAWMLYNDSREAYFIEYGIHPSGYKVTHKNGKTYLKGSRRVRRPIRKLSLMKTLAFVRQSNAGERTWEVIFSPFRPGSENRTPSIINDFPQATEGMRFL